MAKNSSLFTFLAGVAAGAALTAYLRTEEGRRTVSKVKDAVASGLGDLEDSINDVPVEGDAEDGETSGSQSDAEDDSGSK